MVYYYYYKTAPFLSCPGCTSDKYSEVKWVWLTSAKMAGPVHWWLFFYSILISKWRCFLRFDEVKAIHFPAQRGPFSLLPFVLTLRDNHIGDLSLTRLRPCLSRSNTAAGLAWTAKESTPFSTSTETRRGRERENQSRPTILLKAKRKWGCVG